MNELPQILVAPNGARRGKSDHPQLPLIIPEIVQTAKACWHAGAGGLHLHVRDEQGEHTLDAGLYREAIGELKKQLPSLFVQITTEAVGRYSPAEQRQVVKAVQPTAVSVSIAEMLADDDRNAVVDFYHWCDDEGIAVQHILYNPTDLSLLTNLLSSLKRHTSKASHLQLLFVLGRYTKGQQSHPDDLLMFTDWLSATGIQADWGACAFGQSETECLLAAHQAGGKVRVGFENSLWNADGQRALSNEARVAEIKRTLNI